VPTVDDMNRFSQRFGKTLVVEAVEWRYYRLGTGSPVLWLTGGLRRAALGSAALEQLAARHTVVAPDYPAFQKIEQFLAAVDLILRTERVDRVALVGQSYGGLLAQAYLSHRPDCVERLVLSSSGPADYGRVWLPVEQLAIGLARVMPEGLLQNLVVGGLAKLGNDLPADQRTELREYIDRTVRHELTRDDIVSHFAVAADVIRTGAVNREVLRKWHGPLIVLRADNDPTQRRNDPARYRSLFGRDPQVLSMGRLGHAAVLSDPESYCGIIEQALS
jgi:pimeloyl-ACP methyl ester carboxylesterase